MHAGRGEQAGEETRQGGSGDARARNAQACLASRGTCMLAGAAAGASTHRARVEVASRDADGERRADGDDRRQQQAGGHKDGARGEELQRARHLDQRARQPDALHLRRRRQQKAAARCRACRRRVCLQARARVLQAGAVCVCLRGRTHTMHSPAHSIHARAVQAQHTQRTCTRNGTKRWRAMNLER